MRLFYELKGGIIITNKNKRINELVDLLNEASDAYYNKDIEIMSNFEYDALYDELLGLEKETGIILENSPTQKAGCEVVSKLEKTKHEFPALSLDKTKDRESLKAWLNKHEAVLSWKMDGLTVVATYKDGNLIKAATRGNGYVGEIITHNAKYFHGLPQKINYKGKLIVRGEAVMKYSDFEAVNAALPETSQKYKNPRNLASSTVRLLDSKESRKRPIYFYAFDLTYIESSETIPCPDYKSSQFEWLEKEGFGVVEYNTVTEESILDEINFFEVKLKENEFPSDGLVLIYDDELYGKSLGMTGKFPRSGIAFKWADETVDTILRNIEWSASRTGLLNPVAVFDPVELEGTTVSRACVHNVSVAKSFNLGIGSEISVFKANLIIPQIAKTVKSAGPTQIPDICPVCGGKTEIKENDGIETLYCVNPDCPAKHIGIFSHFVSRDAMNIDGLSSATLEKFIDKGWIKFFSDIFHLSSYKNEIVSMEGFGEKSYEKIIDAIEKSRNCTFSAFLCSLGIPGVGKDMAKTISKTLGKDAFAEFVRILTIGDADFTFIEGIGEIVSENIVAWFKQNKAQLNELCKEVTISPDVTEIKAESKIAGKVFVITGSLVSYKNREELVGVIEANGGRVSSSVSSKTDFLINNDKLSSSSKNKKAKELGIAIISEEDFETML